MLQARYGCTKVTDSGLGAIAAGCPNLQELELEVCTSVTDGSGDPTTSVAALFSHVSIDPFEFFCIQTVLCTQSGPVPWVFYFGSIVKVTKMTRHREGAWKGL